MKLQRRDPVSRTARPRDYIYCYIYTLYESRKARARDTINQKKLRGHLFATHTLIYRAALKAHWFLLRSFVILFFVFYSLLGEIKNLRIMYNVM